MTDPHLPDFSQIATYVFVMLGPLKILAPFVTTTRGMDFRGQFKLAASAILMALVALGIAATIGVNNLEKWRVSTGALQLAGGIIIFLVALKAVLNQYEPPSPKPSQPQPQPGSAANARAVKQAFMAQVKKLVFPTIVTPQGAAMVILIIATFPVLKQDMVLAVIVMMCINLVAMLCARKILQTPGVALALTIFGNVLAVMQVALGLQFIINALRTLGALPGG